MNETFLNQLPQEISTVYTSNQPKAIHTGVIAASHVHCPLHIEPNLTELTSLTNAWIEDHEKFVNDIYTGVIERMNNGESLVEARERFAGAVEKIALGHREGDTIAIVAHGNVLALFSSMYEERGAQELQALMQMPDYAVFDWESKSFDKKF